MKKRRRYGPYVVTRRLGAGATGRVVLAEDERSGRAVALKVLVPKAAENPRILDGFRRESRLAMDLSHPNLVSYVDSDLDAMPPWIAFEYVVGTSLDTMVAQKGALDAPLALGIFLDVLYGLAAAHQKGVLHRDVKPQNVLVTARGQVRLIDFGAARIHALPGSLIDGGQDEEGAEHGGWSGTLLYASPEQLQGKELDASSDLYSLGLVLWELLTGERLLRGSQVTEVILQQTDLVGRLPRLAERIPGLPSGLDDLLRELLSFRVNERRWSSAAALVEPVQRLLHEGGLEDAQMREHRLRARLELAETDYCRAQNLLHEGRVEEGLLLLRSLGQLPAETGDHYRKRIREDLRALLWDRAFPPPDGEPSDEDLSLLRQMAAAAKDLGDVDVLALVERRMDSLLASIASREDRLKVCTLFLGVVPDSACIGAACYDLQKERGDAVAARAMRGPLITVFLEKRWLTRAYQLADEALREGDDAARRDRGRRAILDLMRENERSRRKLLRRLEGRSTREGRDLARDHLRENRDDVQVWEALAAIVDEPRASAMALVEAGRNAFAHAMLPTARRLFLEAMRRHPTEGLCLDYLHETLFALGCLPAGFHSARRRRLAMLCQEGLTDRLERLLEHELTGTEGDDAFLQRLAPLARRGGRLDFVAVLTYHRAVLALGRRDMEEGRRLFEEALETSPTPRELLERMTALPGIRNCFRPMELVRLRQELPVTSGTASPRTSDPARPA